ncbi:glycosyltransferase family 2 protein [uncultured Subdoligranulum sp.]|uniref:glycosyltransferase family 2 protein n=1 Tax=uncultured Subdoligranulum sp. TaxID=512298 RepID=UPI002611F16F|nr:glycosyltransferase family 2 protein [uncultured Subdoligranulum sp.]
MQLLSFVIPCYHSAATLAAVTREIRETVLADGRYAYEIILVNDNPADDTWREICRLKAEDPQIFGICMSRNFGQASALMAGYRHVHGDIIVSLDDDGQTPPAEMFRLIDALDEDTDVVYASYPAKHHSAFRNFGSKVNDWMATWLMGKPKDLYMASYYAARRFIIDEMVKCDNPFPYVDGLAVRSTCRFKNIPIDHQDRAEGESGYTFLKLLRLWLNGFTAFSVKPLRVATVMGMVFSAVGFLSAILVIVRKILLLDQIDAGWSSIVSVVLLLDGILMMMLGLVGEYVGRMYMTMNKSPQYVIRTTTAEAGEKEVPAQSAK